MTGCDADFDKLSDIRADIVIVQFVDPRVYVGDFDDIGNCHRDVDRAFATVSIGHGYSNIVHIVFAQIPRALEIRSRPEGQRASFRVNIE